MRATGIVAVAVQAITVGRPSLGALLAAPVMASTKELVSYAYRKIVEIEPGEAQSAARPQRAALGAGRSKRNAAAEPRERG